MATIVPQRACPALSPRLRTASLFSLPQNSNSMLFPLVKNLRPVAAVVCAIKKLNESDLIPLPLTSNEISTKLPSDPGVYAVYDRNKDLQFIGKSKDVAASVSSHFNSLPEFCCHVRVGMVDGLGNAALTEAWESWMEEHAGATGTCPPGNQTGSTKWANEKPVKMDICLTAGRQSSSWVPLEGLIDQVVKDHKVVAFIKGPRAAPLCGFSRRVIQILDAEGADYECVNVLDEVHNPGLRDALKRYSNWPTFPQVFVEGELVGGWDIVNSMHQKGQLAELFQ